MCVLFEWILLKLAGIFELIYQILDLKTVNVIPSFLTMISLQIFENLAFLGLIISCKLELSINGPSLSFIK